MQKIIWSLGLMVLFIASVSIIDTFQNPNNYRLSSSEISRIASPIYLITKDSTSLPTTTTITEKEVPAPIIRPAACADRIDNDQDGKIDYPSDIGCSSPTDDDEYNSATTPTRSDTSISCPADSIVVANATDFARVYSSPTSSFCQVADIDFGNQPIPGYSGSVFSGNYNGNGYSLSNIRSFFKTGIFGIIRNAVFENVVINNLVVGPANNPLGNDDSVGGLSDTISKSTIRNVFINGTINCTQISADKVGGLTGTVTESSITNVHFRGNIVGGNSRCNHVGGLIGSIIHSTRAPHPTTVTNSSFEGNISLLTASSTSQFVGGLISSIVTGSNLTGSSPAVFIRNSHTVVNMNGTDYVAGLVGYNQAGAISDSSSHGQLRASGNTAGGLVGLNLVNYYYGPNNEITWIETPISNSSSTVNISWSNNSDSSLGGYKYGGLVGANVGKIVNSYALGNVTGNRCVGGLVGSSGSVSGCVVSGYASFFPFIHDSYARGAVRGNQYVGGLAGANGSASTIRRSYSSGPVVATSATRGGLTSLNNATVEQSYWDTETSGQSSSAAGEGRTTQQMRTRSNYLDWDFINNWIINEGFDYPRLRR